MKTPQIWNVTLEGTFFPLIFLDGRNLDVKICFSFPKTGGRESKREELIEKNPLK